MLPQLIFYLLVFATLLFLSAFFSGSETAFFSLSAATRDLFKNSDNRSQQRVSRLLDWPRQLLITIVIGNTMVNISIASLAVVLTTRLSRTFLLDEKVVILLDVFVVTFVILIVSEIIPKVVAVRNAKSFSLRTSLLLSFFYYILYPISYALARFTSFLQQHAGFTDDRSRLSEEELKTLADVGEEKGTLQKDEREMIHSILEFGETTVKEIMVPRTDMVMVDSGTTLTQLMKLVKTKLHSRIPVYRQRFDNIVGILYVKDLLPFISRRKKEKLNLDKLMRPAYFVPEQKKIDELLREFQEEHIHMALVVDEYGGLAGLVTLEDIIEEIVGEIQDEHDKEAPLYEKLDENSFMVDGRMPLEELNEELHLNLPTEEGVDTISGFILNILGSLPRAKESVKYKQYRFTVEKINKNRILKIRVERQSVQQDETTQTPPDE